MEEIEKYTADIKFLYKNSPINYYDYKSGTVCMDFQSLYALSPENISLDKDDFKYVLSRTYCKTMFYWEF